MKKTHPTTQGPALIQIRLVAMFAPKLSCPLWSWSCLIFCLVTVLLLANAGDAAIVVANAPITKAAAANTATIARFVWFILYFVTYHWYDIAIFVLG